MAKAERKPTHRPMEEPYAEPEEEEFRRPPYFGEREPLPIAAVLAGASGLHVDLGQQYTVNVLIPPLKAAEWLKAAAARLSASPLDSVRQVTDVARQLEREMYEALHRGQCDAHWSWGFIKNTLISKGWWPRTRLPSPRQR